MVVFAYISAPNPQVAESLADALVNERLAACVNIFRGVAMTYRWHGRVEKGEETILIAKTRDDLFDALADRARAMLGEECPGIVALPVSMGFAPFLQWISDETGTQPGEA